MKEFDLMYIAQDGSVLHRDMVEGDPAAPILERLNRDNSGSSIAARRAARDGRNLTIESDGSVVGHCGTGEGTEYVDVSGDTLHDIDEYGSSAASAAGKLALPGQVEFLIVQSKPRL